jgi:ATP-dependent Clp protease protease subunit
LILTQKINHPSAYFLEGFDIATCTVNDFTEENVTVLSQQLQIAVDSPQTIIPVIINSYGGDVYALMAMIDLIQNCPKTIATVVMGKAMSCGAFFASYGAPGMRFISSNSTVMVHDVSSGQDFTKIGEMEVSAAEARRLQNKIFTDLAVRNGVEKSYYLDIMHSRGHTDWYLTPKEAVKHRLVDHIGVPKYKMEVQVSEKFGIKV